MEESRVSRELFIEHIFHDRSTQSPLFIIFYLYPTRIGGVQLQRGKRVPATTRAHLLEIKTFIQYSTLKQRVISMLAVVHSGARETRLGKASVSGETKNLVYQ